MMAAAIIELKGVERHYEQGERKLTILNGADFTLRRGEMVALVAPSGTGKSTLLHTAGLLERPDAGDVILGGRACGRLSDEERTAIRRNDVGFVYQFHHLLPEFHALDNVAMPLIVRRQGREEARAAARAVLEQVGLAARAEHYPGQLSGGERQRVALARALVTRPACVLADEPTGNLDRHTAHDIYELLSRVNRESGTAFVIVTHDQELAARADRVLHMERGKLVAD